MREFIIDNVKESYKDDATVYKEWVTEKEAWQTLISQALQLVILILIAAVTPFTFTQMVLFLILTELIAIKGTLRRGMTRLR